MKTKYTQNEAKNQLIAERGFKAPKSKVWKHYTTSELLDKWWGPKPYQAVTKSFEFKPGGHWKYVMAGPKGEAHHCLNEFQGIDPENSFTATDAFTDENWNVNPALPSQIWEITFTEDGEMTNIKVVITFKSMEDLEAIVKMGMKEGFDMGLNQLEELLNTN